MNLSYALAQFVANLALAAQFNCLEAVGVDEPKLSQLRAWAKEVHRFLPACICVGVRPCVHATVCLCVHAYVCEVIRGFERARVRAFFFRILVHVRSFGHAHVRRHSFSPLRCMCACACSVRVCLWYAGAGNALSVSSML